MRVITPFLICWPLAAFIAHHAIMKNFINSETKLEDMEIKELITTGIIAFFIQIIISMLISFPIFNAFGILIIDKTNYL